jgi:CheY-like chemotaxis protein
MSADERFRVLLIDDQPEEARALETALQRYGDAAVYEPSEITAEALQGNDVVLVDYDLSQWDVSARETEPSCSPADGLALAAVLRSRVMPDYRKARPVAFALHSSQLHRIGGNLDQEVREHAIARVHNLEWVFDKRPRDDMPPLAERVREFAAAVRSLPDDWPSEPADARDALAGLLAWSPDLPGAELALAHVMRSYPPLHELSVATDGLTCLRWLAHRILPYPCFLYDALHVAVRLRLDPGEVARAADDVCDGLGQALAERRYRGALSELVGRRWWRAGIDEWLWSLSGNTPLDADELHSALERVAGRELQPLALAGPVVVLDERYRPLSRPAAIEEAVRIRPDDWPPFADDAWTTLELAAAHPRLRDQVVPDDRDLLDDGNRPDA